jgi:hypothetical protein
MRRRHVRRQRPVSRVDQAELRKAGERAGRRPGVPYAQRVDDVAGARAPRDDGERAAERATAAGRVGGRRGERAAAQREGENRGQKGDSHGF